MASYHMQEFFPREQPMKCRLICLGLFAEGASKRRPLDLVAASIERPLQVLGASRSPKFAEACYFVSLITFLHCYTPVIPGPIERD